MDQILQGLWVGPECFGIGRILQDWFSVKQYGKKRQEIYPKLKEKVGRKLEENIL